MKPGQLGHTACFSFYATKNITCGEGGAVVTDDPSIAERLRLLRLHGMTKNAADRDREGYQHWDMVSFGWKYNLDNIHAAIMLPQLSRLEQKWERRQQLAAAYTRVLSTIPGVRLPQTAAGVRHAHHLFVAWFDPSVRDRVLAHLQKNQVSVMVNYRAIHLLSYFKGLLGSPRGDFPQAELIGDSTISLPFYPGMPIQHVDRVVNAIDAAVACR